MPTLPQVPPTPKQAPSGNKAPNVPRTLSGESSPETSRTPTAKPRDERQQVEPLSPARYKVQFTASAELRDKLERLAALMPGEELASVIESAVTEKLERLEASRYGKVKKPKKELAAADTSPGVRGISAPVKRFVWERDGGQCTFESADGRRCLERRSLEFHHDDPYALGGDRGPGNIRLLCKQHNAYMAEMDYGKAKMSQYRRSAERVREPVPAFFDPAFGGRFLPRQLSPDRVVTSMEVAEVAPWCLDEGRG